MEKPLILIGAALAVLGAVLLAFFVIPYAGSPPVEDTQAIANSPSMASPLIAVLTGGLGLAAGFALIGIGVGRWQRPTRSETLPLGQTRNSSEV